ncbi:hypothetical protein GNF76_04845 [Pseudomonas sp. CCM 7893]|uniref:Response regulator n=1 Tax=Pseudomonas spelaei TaxID=1055469 RepID=A0A6I3W2C1_9PSED|nr:hypothetical protein [Pseudomonas spelaei]MUF03648.1 hypothetical protein [Pseudomonas spelaei]
MSINEAIPPKLILYSQSPGLLLQYWASLNALGIYNVTPCAIWATLMQCPPSADRYDLLLYDHSGVDECLSDVLPRLAERRVARQIIVLTHIDPAPRHRLLAWAMDKGIALLDVANPPMDSKTLLGLLEKWGTGRQQSLSRSG